MTRSSDGRNSLSKQVCYGTRAARYCMLMQHEVGRAGANRAADVCANLCANSAKRDESHKNQEGFTAPVTPITATLRRPRTY